MMQAFRLRFGKLLDLLAGRQGFEPRYRGPERPGKRGTVSTGAECSRNSSRHMTAFRAIAIVPHRSIGRDTQCDTHERGQSRESRTTFL